MAGTGQKTGEDEATSFVLHVSYPVPDCPLVGALSYVTAFSGVAAAFCLIFCEMVGLSSLAT